MIKYKSPPTQPAVSGPSSELHATAVQRIGKYTPATPIDQSAADILFRRNDEVWEPHNEHNQNHSCNTPIPTLPRYMWPHNTQNLVGAVFGRMRVVGLINEQRSARGLMWACRCLCGCYEARRTAAIQNKRNIYDRCYECRKLDRLKAAERHRATGEFTCAGCGTATKVKGGCGTCEPDRINQK